MKFFVSAALLFCSTRFVNAQDDPCKAAHSDEQSCDADHTTGGGCVWCKCAALPSSCWTKENAAKLPAGVYICDKSESNQISDAHSTSNVKFQPQFVEKYSKSSRHNRGYEVVTKTYVSQALPLLPGQMMFTQPRHTPVQMPDGRYAILAFKGDIAKRDPKNSSNFVAVPLSEVYDHHWIVESTKHNNPFCGGSPKYVFGIGAESRNTYEQFPEGYGYHVEPGAEWGGNIHILRTEHLAGDNPRKSAKECNECYYAEGKQCSPRENGTFSCCGENCYQGDTRCRCPFASDAPTSSEEYFLRYTLSYTTDVSQIKPLSIGVITTPDCALYYNVLRNDTHPEQVSRTSFHVPRDATIIFGVGHQHTGSLNISLSLNDKFVCASYPTYGTEEGMAGNELGYLVKMSVCIDSETRSPGSVPSLPVKKGDTITIESWYYAGSDDSRLAYSDGTHLNVMGYFYLAFI